MTCRPPFRRVTIAVTVLIFTCLLVSSRDATAQAAGPNSSETRESHAGDPMWCPEGVLPGGVGCTASFTTFTGPGGLLAALAGGSYSGDGVIYVEDSYHSLLETGTINIDGGALTALGNLTIQGGWNGVLGSANIVGTSMILGIDLSVTNWPGRLTVRDIDFFGGALVNAGAGTLILDGANTYTGQTRVSAGTLLVNGSTAAGTTIVVASGATLGGIGTINGNVAVRTGGTIDTASLSVIGTVYMIPPPPAGLLLYTIDQYSRGMFSSALRINADGTIAYLARIADGLDFRQVAVRADQAVAYFAGSGRIVTVDTRTHAIVDEDELPAFAEAMALSPDGTQIYVIDRDSDTVVAFQAEAVTGALTFSSSIPVGDTPVSLAFNPDGSKLFVANSKATNLTVIDTATNTIDPVSPVPLAGYPYRLAMDRAGARLFVLTVPSPEDFGAIDEESTIRILDVESLTPIGTPFATGIQPDLRDSLVVSHDGAFLYATLRNGEDIKRFDVSTGPPVLVQSMTLTLGLTANSTPLLSPDGRYLYLPSGELPVVDVADDGTLYLEGTHHSGGNVHLFDMCANGNALLASGKTFVANTAEAIGCTNNQPTFAGGTLRVNGAGLTFTTPFALGTGGGAVDTNGFDATIAGPIGGGAPLAKNGTGTLTLSVANTYTGGTTVNGGTLRAGAANVFGVNSDMTVVAGAVLDLAGFNQTVGGLAGSGDIALGAATLTTVNAIASVKLYEGTISGSGGLSKAGNGFLYLYGTHGYTGPTTVNAGGLVLEGSIASSSVLTIANGARLDGDGTAGPLVAQSGALINPGDSGPGLLTTGSLSLNAGSRLFIELNGVAPGQYDRLSVTGGVALAGVLNVTFGFTPAIGQVFTIIDNDGVDPVVGTFFNRPQNAVFFVGATTFRISYTGGVGGNDVTLTVQATPTLGGGLSQSTIIFGNSVQDFATLTGGFNTTGAITWNLYGPNNATCSGTPAFTASTNAIPNNPSYASPLFTPTTAGTYRMVVTFAGDGFNLPAATGCGAAGRILTVLRADQMIAFAPLPNRALGSGPFTVSATGGGSAKPVTFLSQTMGVCTMSGNAVTLVALGTCTIAADQEGDSNYNPAPQVLQSFSVAADCSVPSLPGTLAAGQVALPYAYSLTLTNGAPPISFGLTGALPSGVTFTNGLFAGTPTVHGAFPVTVTATDANSCQVSASYNLAIALERRLLIGTATGASTVRAFNIGSATVRSEINAFGSFTGGVAVAHGDVDGNGVADIIAGAGPGAGPAVRVFDGGSNALRLTFFAFDPAYQSGVTVATGDVTGDGVPDVLAAAGCAGAPQVRAFDGRTGAFVRGYTIPLPAITCRLNVAAGDVTGDGIADVLVGAGDLGASFVEVVDGWSGAALRELYPFGTAFTGGVSVAAADVTGDGLADIVTGAGPGGTPHVRVFDGTTGAQIGGPLGSFHAYVPLFPGGVRVGAGDLNGDGRAEVITVPASNGGPHVRVFDGASATEIYGLYGFDASYGGGLFVAGPVPAARMNVDIAARTTGTDVRIAGWALREIANDTTGTDAIHAWAYPIAGGPPVFVGEAPTRVPRPDLAAAFGGQFLMSGFDFGGTLAAGTYDLVVYVRNSRTTLFDQVRVLRVTVP
jgi:fibronectin-binding autotransporter adhesin